MKRAPHRYRTHERRRHIAVAVTAAALAAGSVALSAPASAAPLIATGLKVTAQNQNVVAHCSLTVQNVSADGQLEQVRLTLDARPSGVSGYFNNVWTQVHCFVNVPFIGDSADFTLARNSPTISSASETLTIATGASPQICGEALVVLRNATSSPTGTSCS